MFLYVNNKLNIYEMTSSLVNSVSTEIRRLRIRFPSEAQKHFSEFAIELEYSKQFAFNLPSCKSFYI